MKFSIFILSFLFYSHFFLETSYAEINKNSDHEVEGRDFNSNSSDSFLERLIYSQNEMIKSYSSQTEKIGAKISVKVATLNTFLVDSMFIANPEYKKSLSLFETLMKDGRFLKEFSGQNSKQPDFIAIQELFGDKKQDLKPLLEQVYKMGYVSVFNLYKKHEKTSSRHKRKKMGLDIWVKRTWLQGKVYGKDFRVGFKKYKRSWGVDLVHALEILGGYKRGVLWIELPVGNKKLLLTSTHLTPLKVKSWVKVRVAQAKILEKWIQNHSADFVILSGDMNSSDVFEFENEETPNFRPTISKAYLHMISSSQLFDSFRIPHPRKAGYTYDPIDNPKRGGLKKLEKKSLLKSLASMGGEILRKFSKLFSVLSLNDYVDEYNEYVSQDKIDLENTVKTRVDHHFIRGKDSHFVKILSSQIVFKKPFVRFSGDEPSYLSDHYGLVSEVEFQYGR